MVRMWTSRRPRTSDPKRMYGLWKAIKWWQSRPASGLSPWNGRYSADHALGREIYRGCGHRYRVWTAWKADTCRTSGGSAWIEKLGGRRKSTFLKSYKWKRPKAIVFGCFFTLFFPTEKTARYQIKSRETLIKSDSVIENTLFSGWRKKVVPLTGASCYLAGTYFGVVVRSFCLISQLS